MKLPDYNAPSALAAVLDEHGFGMQKKFGQNFLINAHIRQELISALGLSGLFSRKKHGLYIGYIVACLGRFFFAFLSGLLFFAAYAPEGMNPAWYSFLYNISYISIEAAVTIAVLLIPAVHKTIYRLKGKFIREEPVPLRP